MKGWNERFGKKLREGRDLLKEASANSCRPSDAVQQLIGRAGVYCIRTASAGEIDYRGWRWVRNIGGSIQNGRRAETIKPSHNVLFVLEDDAEEGKSNLWKLRLAERFVQVAG